VFVNMRDAQGNTTGRIYLNNPMRDDFERGQTDILSRAKIEDMAAGTLFLFECNRWLSQNAGDGKTMITLNARVATS
jgi:hypothetical protein